MTKESEKTDILNNNNSNYRTGYELLPGPFSNLRDINFGIILLAAYILLDFGSFQGVFESLQVIRIPFIVAALSSIYAFYLIVTGKIDWKKTSTIAFTLFVIYVIIDSQLRSKDPVGTKANLTLFIQYLANYLIMVTCVKKPSQFILIIDIFLAGIIHSCFHAIMQGGRPWDSIWLKDENHIAIISAYAIPFALVLFTHYKIKFKKVCYAIGLFFYVAANCVAASRGGALAMIGGVFLWWIMYKRKIRNLLIALFAIILVFSLAPKQFFSEMDTLRQGTEEGTASERIYMWKIAWRMFCDNPLLGVGQYNYSIDSIKYDEADRFFRRYYVHGYGMVAHSTPMQFLAESGIVGSFFFIFLLFCQYKTWKVINSRINSISRQINQESELDVFKAINNACGIAQAVFWIAALFLTLTPYPFYWILIAFSETWGKLFLDYINKKDVALDH